MVSFYKITTLDNLLINPPTPTDTSIRVGNNFLWIFVLIFTNTYINTILKPHTSAPKNTIIIFRPPRRKKSVIFLRAPYKNKLARLNILRLKYSIIFSIINKATIMYVSNLPELKKILAFMDQFDISSQRLKHQKTSCRITIKYPLNFFYKNFL